MPENQQDTINFTLQFGEKIISIETFRNEHHSLMSLISDRLSLPGFGLCCGMGSCGECKVRIQKKGEKTGIFAQSCGISVNEELDMAVITIISGY